MTRSRTRSHPGLLVLTAAVTTATVAAVVAAPAGATTAGPLDSAAAAAATPAAPAEPPLTLKAPARMTYTTYGRNPVQSVPFDARMVAGADPFVVWSTRSSYAEPVRTVWRSPGGDVPIKRATSSRFGRLGHMVHLTVTRVRDGAVVLSKDRGVCLATQSERVRPDAPPYSPYPRTDCYANPYALGQVQGIQAGWATSVFGYNSPLRLAPGRYRVRLELTPGYVRALGLDPATSATTTRLQVLHQRDYPGEGDGDGGGHDHGHRTGRPGLAPTPAARAPRGPAGAPEDGPRPDLRSLPAWGMSLDPKGRHLRFAATVWNAGNSPLVVDGFRRDGEDEMDAYQYFFDGDGNQTGYQQIGHMHWDARDSHQHWHFKDFASYTLLDSSKKLVRTSGKEAFCLANTDSVDLTVPDAAWDAYNEDLETACGEYTSLSVREVLAAGWGDTYSQYRAGQSFNISALPDGVYYVAVTANPDNRLVEASQANNRSLRRIVIGTHRGKRTLRVPRLGMVVEHSYGREGLAVAPHRGTR